MFSLDGAEVDVAEAETEMTIEAPGIGILPDFTMP
jgi:hypothetical protein